MQKVVLLTQILKQADRQFLDIEKGVVTTVPSPSEAKAVRRYLRQSRNWMKGLSEQLQVGDDVDVSNVVGKRLRTKLSKIDYVDTYDVTCKKVGSFLRSTHLILGDSRFSGIIEPPVTVSVLPGKSKVPIQPPRTVSTLPGKPRVPVGPVGPPKRRSGY